LKNKLYLAYTLGAGQVLSLITTIYLVFHQKLTYKLLFRSTEVHFWFQFLIAVILLYTVYHFIRIINISLKMRKVAREQREAKSKRIELLILTLMFAFIFYALFYTVPFRYYFPSDWEYFVYFFNSLLMLLMLISLISSHAEASKDFIKAKQKYAGIGAVAGFLSFYIYIQLIS
jgi:hypothetical protein